MLGVIFDRKMTWTPHINQIIVKCNKVFNIMRCISGTNWGASQKILLLLHKTLILPHIDYCSFAFANSANSNIRKLDTLQYKSLIIVTGAMKGTAKNSLLAECEEIPLDLRRESQLLKYLLKLANNPFNFRI